MAYDGKQMPSGSAEDRLCDLDDCPRRSETLVAADDGSILLVCTSCATLMSSTGPGASPGVPAGGYEVAPETVPMRVVPRDEDDTCEFPAIREEIAAPAAVPAKRPARARGWAFWLRLLVGTVLTVWGLVLLAGDAGAFDGVVTGAVGGYVLLNLARPRYRD